MRLSAIQLAALAILGAAREAVRANGTTGRDGRINAGTADALARRGLATVWEANGRLYAHITPKGRGVLARLAEGGRL